MKSTKNSPSVVYVGITTSFSQEETDEVSMTFKRDHKRWVCLRQEVKLSCRSLISDTWPYNTRYQYIEIHIYIYIFLVGVNQGLFLRNATLIISLELGCSCFRLNYSCDLIHLDHFWWVEFRSCSAAPFIPTWPPRSCNV